LAHYQVNPETSSYYRYTHDPYSILSKPDVSENIRTLILDNLPSVNAGLVGSILSTDGRLKIHRIEILSIRNCPKLDDRILASLMLGDLPNTLKGIYYFSDPEMDFLPPASGGAKVFVSPKMGRMLNTARRKSTHPAEGGWWAVAMRMLRGKVAFDAEMCNGLAHYQVNPETSEWEEQSPGVATMRLTKGCAGCGAHPETENHVVSVKGDVLFPPVPIHTSTLTSAKSTWHVAESGGVKVTLRCTGCLDKRYCRGCGSWWCQPCAERHDSDSKLVQPTAAEGALVKTQIVSLDCFECGHLCKECTNINSRVCMGCGSCYCTLHNEGSNPHYCEWCIHTTSRRRCSISSAVSRIALGRSNATSPSEIDNALSAIATLSDPTTIFPPITQLTSPTSASSSTSKLKGKGLAGPTGAGAVTGPPASPILKAMSGKGEMHRAAGMRLRTMIGGVGPVGSGAGAGVIGSGNVSGAAGVGGRRGSMVFDI